MLAKFYLSENSKESLKGFAESTGTFKLLLVVMDAHSAKMKAHVPS